MYFNNVIRSITNQGSQSTIEINKGKEIVTIDNIKVPFQVSNPIKRNGFTVLGMAASLAPFSFYGTAYIGKGLLNLGILGLANYVFSRLISIGVLPALSASKARKNNANEYKRNFIENSKTNFHEFDLKLADGATVNGMTLFRNSAACAAFKEKKADQQKWIISFNGNNMLYEENLFGFKRFADSVDANILVFNYRGVNESKQFPTAPENLIADGEACVKYLLSKGVQEENILIHGLSLGGGVGTQVAILHEKMALINERSFSSLSTVASALTGTSLVGKILQGFGWELDSLKAFEKLKNRKLIVYHKQDAVMPYQKASLYKVFKERLKAQNIDVKPTRVKLQREFSAITPMAHGYSLQGDKAFPQIQKFINEFFGR